MTTAGPASAHLDVEPPRFTQRLSAATLRELQDGVRRRLEDEGLEAVLVDHPEDVAYLTGFFAHPSERPIAVWLGVDGSALLLVPALEAEHAAEQTGVAELVVYPEYPGTTPPYAHLAGRVPPGRIGHGPSASWQTLQAIRAALPDCEVVPTSAVTQARQVKHPAELVLHDEAARVTESMIRAGLALVRDAVAAGGPMPSESELAAAVTSHGVRTMYAEHDDVVVVPLLAGGLVYAGARSALPHGLASGYRMQPGDPFMLSLGCAVGGRYVECERTFILGEPTADQVRWYEAVREAQEVGAAAIAPGRECREVNADCLAVIRDAGLGQYLRHRQGHGIGLGFHEPPWLEDGDATVLKEGMVLSNEPGIYIPDHGGYRISDTMLVTPEGSRRVTEFPRTVDDIVIAL